MDKVYSTNYCHRFGTDTNLFWKLYDAEQCIFNIMNENLDEFKEKLRRDCKVPGQVMLDFGRAFRKKDLHRCLSIWDEVMNERFEIEQLEIK